MSNDDLFFQDARKAYRLAADSTNAADIARHAGRGRECLIEAHKAAKVIDRRPSFWRDAPLGSNRHE